MISNPIKEKILSVVSVFETSKLLPAYDTLAILPDGPNGDYQITYGKHQTTEHSNLKELLTLYCNSYGKYARDIKSYLPFIGDPSKKLYKNMVFRQLLKSAGSDITMHEVQDKFFEDRYWKPAERFFNQNNFTLPLSMLVIYDSFIQSGGILDFLRRRFGERTPINSGNEKRWITAYTKVRDKWLEDHTKEIIRATDYRTDCLLEAIEQENWDLSKPLLCRFNSSDRSNWMKIL